MRVDPDTLPDFSYAAHRKMYLAGINNPSHQYLVGLDPKPILLGIPSLWSDILRTGSPTATFGVVTCCPDIGARGWPGNSWLGGSRGSPSAKCPMPRCTCMWKISPYVSSLKAMALR